MTGDDAARRARATQIAMEAIRQHLAASTLGRFSDREWQELVESAGFVDVGPRTCVVAVEIVREFEDTRERERTRDRAAEASERRARWFPVP